MAAFFIRFTPSTEGGEILPAVFRAGELNVFGHQKIAIECEGEHAAQGGATAYSVAGRRTVNFTSGQGIVYAMEQYLSCAGQTFNDGVEVGARALTKHALNVHCGHDDFYAALDTGWTMLMGKDAQQAADRGLSCASQRTVAQPRHEYPGWHAHDAFRADLSGAGSGTVARVFGRTRRDGGLPDAGPA